MNTTVLEDSGVRVPVEAEDFFLSTENRPALGPTSYPTCFGGPYAGIKVAGPASAPFSEAEVKNGWSNVSTPPYVFTTCTGTTLHLLTPKYQKKKKTHSPYGKKNLICDRFATILAVSIRNEVL